MRPDRYSLLVALLKVLLPLMSLALLSTLFLLSRTVDPELVIPFAEKEIQDRLRDQQVTGPFYNSTTDSGDRISFEAESLRTPEGKTGENEADDVEVVMDLSSGGQVRLRSNKGHFFVARDQAELIGDVVITTTSQYRIESQKMLVRMTALNVQSPGAVHAVGPLGTLDAGAMELRSSENGDPSQLIFTNGVKLIYQPEIDDE